MIFNISYEETKFGIIYFTIYISDLENILLDYFNNSTSIKLSKQNCIELHIKCECKINPESVYLYKFL